MAWLRIDPDRLVHVSKKIDSSFYSAKLAKFPHLKKKLKKKVEKEVVADLFLMLNKESPELKPRKDSPDPALDAWIRRELASGRISDLKKETIGDSSKSLFAAVKMFQEMMRPEKSGFKDIVQLKIADNATRVMAEHFGMDLDLDLMKESYQAIAEQIDKNENEYKQHNMSEVTNTVSEDMKAVAEFMKLDPTGANEKGFDLSSIGDRMLEIGLNEEFFFIRDQEAFRKVMRYLGRIRLLAAGIRSKKPKKTATQTGITMSDDIRRILPSELLMKSISPGLFWRKFTEKQLMSYDNEKKVKEGRGPIVVIVDNSGSMNGDPMNQANAFFLEMVRQASKEHRRCVYIPFASLAGEPFEVKTRNDLTQLITGRRHYYIGSGTNFNEAIKAGIKVVEQEKQYKNADIILISDAEGQWEFKTAELVAKFKDKTGSKILGALTPNRYSSAVSWPHLSDKIMDKSLIMKQNNIEWMEELMKGVLS